MTLNIGIKQCSSFPTIAFVASIQAVRRTSGLGSGDTDPKRAPSNAPSVPAASSAFAPTQLFLVQAFVLVLAPVTP